MRLIDADELKKCAIPCDLHNGVLTDLYVPLYQIICQINSAPTVETSKIEHKAYNEGFKDGVDQGIKLSERPHGKWLLCEDSDFSKCSICGVIWLNEECNNYCPNCGTYMRSENNGKK